MRGLPSAFSVLVALLALGLGVSLYWIFGVAPIEARMGIVQKIFYFHVPSAIAMYLAFLACGLGSLLYLLGRGPRWDALALAGGEVGLLFGGMVLVTGPLWAKGAWGTAWVWDDPQLTATLILFLVYATYLFLRHFLRDQPGAARVPAILAVIGVLDIPLIHFSVRLWRGQHPRVIRSGGGGLGPEMFPALMISMACFVLLAILMIWLRCRIERGRQHLDEVELDLLEKGDSMPTALINAARARHGRAGWASMLLPALLAVSMLHARAAHAAPPAPTTVPSELRSDALPAVQAARAAGPARPQSSRSIPGGTLALIAYACIWLLTLLYLLYLGRLQARLDLGLEELRKELRASPGSPPSSGPSA